MFWMQQDMKPKTKAFLQSKKYWKIPWIIDDSFTKNSYCQLPENTSFVILWKHSYEKEKQKKKRGSYLSI